MLRLGTRPLPLVPPLAGGYSANCSYQGVLAADGQCACRSGYVGLRCELCAGGECLFSPPELCAPACKPPAVCRKGVCICPRGMCGPACDWACDCGCGEVLWAHGVCDEGAARCEAGWRGKAAGHSGATRAPSRVRARRPVHDKVRVRHAWLGGVRVMDAAVRVHAWVAEEPSRWQSREQGYVV